MQRSGVFAIIVLFALLLLVSAGGMVYFLFSARRAEEISLMEAERAEAVRHQEALRLRAEALRRGAESSSDADPEPDPQVEVEGEPNAETPPKVEGDALAVSFGDRSRSLLLSRLPWDRWSEELALLHADFEEAEGDVEKIAAISQRYESFANRLTARLPPGLATHAKRFGEMTHPIVAANLMVSMLSDVGVPLDEEQMRKLSNLGSTYESEVESLTLSYSEDASRLRMMIDEVELKRGAAAQFERELSAEQRQVVRVIDGGSMLGASLLSPGWSLDVVEVTVASREEAVLAFENHLRELGVKDIPDAVRDSWSESAEHFLSSEENSVLQSAVLAGWAQVRAIEQLASAQDDPTRDRLLGASRVFLPVQTSEED